MNDLNYSLLEIICLLAIASFYWFIVGYKAHNYFQKKELQNNGLLFFCGLGKLYFNNELVTIDYSSEYEAFNIWQGETRLFSFDVDSDINFKWDCIFNDITIEVECQVYKTFVTLDLELTQPVYSKVKIPPYLEKI